MPTQDDDTRKDKPAEQQEAQELPKRGPGGRPAHKVTASRRLLVRIMIAQKATKERIAEYLGISQPTLRAYYAEEIRTTLDGLNAEVAAKLFETATKGKGPDARRAQELWLRCKAGWSEFTPKPWAPATNPLRDNEEKPEKLGKKAQADLDAGKTPQVGGWSKLVN